jgi:cytochrome c556
MNPWFRCAVRAVFVLLIAPAVVLAEDADVIDYRQHVMATLGEQSEALSMIVQKKVPADNFNILVDALALASTQALNAFEPKAEGGNAKPEVWKSWPDFSAQMKQLVANLAELDKLAKSGGVTAAAPKIQSLLTCQKCHDTYYRTPPAKTPSTEADAVQYRRHIMSSMDEQSVALGQIITMDIPGTNLASHLEVIAVTAAGALNAFEPKVAGGDAKPEVWSNWVDFSKRMNDFAQKTAEAAKVAKEKGNDAALPGIVDALTCKNCHETYRKEKKK